MRACKSFMQLCYLAHKQENFNIYFRRESQSLCTIYPSFDSRNSNVVFLQFLSIFLSTYDVKQSFFLEIMRVMEGRAHPSDKSSLISSRMKQDLSSSRHIPKTCMNSIKTNVTRRIIPEGTIPHVCIVGAGISGNQHICLFTNPVLKLKN